MLEAALERHARRRAGRADDLDPRQPPRRRPGARDRRARDRDARLGERLPHLPQVQAGRPAPGREHLPRRGARRARRRPAPAAAPGGRDPGAGGVRAAVRRGGRAEVAAPYGPEVRPKFRVCDTMGLGLRSTTWPRRARSRGWSAGCGQLGVASEDLEFHPHNDTHLVVAELPRRDPGRLRRGQRHAARQGRAHRQRAARGGAAARHRDGLLRDPLPDFTRAQRPGRAVRGDRRAGAAPSTRCTAATRTAPAPGIHADGLNKFWWMYAPFDVPRLLGRPLEVSLTTDSGLAGLIFVVRQHTGRELAKDDPELQRVHAELARQFDAGRQTAVEWEEIVGCCAARRPPEAQPIWARPMMLPSGVGEEGPLGVAEGRDAVHRLRPRAGRSPRRPRRARAAGTSRRRGR